MLDAQIAEVSEAHESLQDKDLPYSVGNMQRILKEDSEEQPPNPRGRVFARFNGGMAMGPDIIGWTEEGAQLNVGIPSSRKLIRDVWHASSEGHVHEAMDETLRLTPEIINEEQFASFYPQLVLFAAIGSQENLPALLPAIVEKVKTEGSAFSASAFPRKEEDQQVMMENLNGLMVSCFQSCEEQNRKLSKDAVEMIYQDAMTNPELLYYAHIFDDRNKGSDDFLNIKERVGDVLSQKMQTPEGIEEVGAFLPFIPQDIMIELIISSLKKAESREGVVAVLQALTPATGVEQLRKSLREYVNSDESFKPVFTTVFEYMELDPTNDLASELSRDVYDKIDFSEYKPNEEIQEFELKLLEGELAGRNNVLDVACGTGRHLMALDGSNGLRITGMDITKKHIDYIKEKRPESDVAVGSWFDIPYEDNKFDAACLLGRSFTHNTTVMDAINCLKEIKRVIRDDGVIILDLPDPGKGDYKEYIEKTKNTAERKGLKKVLPGLISDSPDLEHYFDRYAPAGEAFMAIAALAGLDAWKLPVEKSFHGASGSENVNTYWILKKTDSMWINRGHYMMQTRSTKSATTNSFRSPSKLYQTKPSWSGKFLDDE